MISMKSKSPFKVDFFWIGMIPDDNRQPGETLGHYSFFVNCMYCDRWYVNHLVKCDSEQELVELFSLYEKRLKDAIPFKLFPEDFVVLASNTWKDPEYQVSRAAKKHKG